MVLCLKSIWKLRCEQKIIFTAFPDVGAFFTLKERGLIREK